MKKERYYKTYNEVNSGTVENSLNNIHATL